MKVSIQKVPGYSDGMSGLKSAYSLEPLQEIIIGLIDGDVSLLPWFEQQD